MSAAEASGVDLARVALFAAREAAKARTGDSPRQPGRRRGRTVRGTGRDPVGLGAAIAGLISERAWEEPAAGGSVLDQWPAIAPDLCAHVAAVGFDPRSGRLDLRPDSSAWATQLRLVGGQLMQRANAAVGPAVVRTIRVLAPGAPGLAPATRESSADRPSRPAPTGPQVEVRPVGTDAYHQARADARAARAAREEAAAAAAAQRSRPSVSAWREPEDVFLAGRLAADPEPAAEDGRTRALRRLRAEGSVSAPRCAQDTAAS